MPASIHEADANIHTNADGLYVARQQVIPREFLDRLQSERHAKEDIRSADYDRVASVPTFVWELWIRQGRDPMNATGHQIVAWLKQDSLDAFIATPKRV